MATAGWKAWVVCLLVAGAIVGCKTPPLPEGKTLPDGYGEDDDGWLFRSLTGQDDSSNDDVGIASAESAAPSTEAGRASAVQQASATEPADALAPETDGPILRSPDGNDEDDEGIGLGDFAPDKIVENTKAAIGLGPDEEKARRYYEEGEALFEEKKYEDAAAKFKSAAGRWPDSILEEDALFMAGESYFFADRYTKSFDTLDRLLKKHENSRHLDKAVARLFAIGRYWEQAYEAKPSLPVTPNVTDQSKPLFDTWGNALKAYERVWMNDPTGPLADDALMATANAYFVRERFEDAAYYYDRLRKDYPQSEHQVEAHLLALKSKQESYQGPRYDSTPLEEADEIAEQALLQFPRQLGEQRELVIKARQRIHAQLAEREWAMGQFYEKKSEYGAARYYYENLIRDYPQTELARQAEQRLQALSGLPDKPVNHFEWLTDTFEPED